MDAAPALRVISKHGSGTDTIDKPAAAARGIAVTAAVGANAAAVAEQALALLLACAKSVVQLNARMHAGHWDKATHKSLELGGRTIGLVGLGAIGQRFARMCDAMGMRVIGFDPYARALPACVQAVDLDHALARGRCDLAALPADRRQPRHAERGDPGAVQARGDRGQHRPRWPDR
jgi:D-3-phosphoglycerate dehydrogenase